MQKNEVSPDFHHDIHKIHTIKSNSISSDAVLTPMNFQTALLSPNVKHGF